eukprot:CAMPEP_0181490480 /NCGR_PEP_ID=MMETSP1110-20121109/49577_1 /TAXON_ID=174948 /ORGANISM="Symbiodinium sp., Strain CCMP421" /LENGTH=95 /DNA_ID=CAMNT_0023617461 /DNA_START=6 /DNA_END=290 /DNA_ORIENTATION=+
MQAEEVTEVQTDEVVAPAIFSEEELQDWGGAKAVEWILGARSFFEVLGIRPNPSPELPELSSLRNRYRKLSLLVHPDKNQHSEAAACFQRLSEAM